MRSEANILNDCMIALSQEGARVFRNNTGVLKDKTGRPVKFGLCKGGSDIIGICPDGKFLAVEVKRANGKPTEHQMRFIDMIRSMGGRAGIARSAQDAIDIMRS